MKLNLLTTFVLLTLIQTNILSAISAPIPRNQANFPENPVDFNMMIKEKLSDEFSLCRQFLAEKAQYHVAVLKQYDDFVTDLVQAYELGQGMIADDLTRILEVIAFAANKHSQQKRKGGLNCPYIIHPIGVAHILLTTGQVRDPDILMGAILHDTVEDTDTTFQEIEDRFGSRITEFVKEVTDNKSLPQQERKDLQISNAPHKSAGAAQIKLADKLYNLRDLMQSPPSDWSQERIDRYFIWAKAVTDGLPWVNGNLKAALNKIFE